MKTFDPHSLLNNEVKKIDINGTPAEVFDIWYKKAIHNTEVGMFDAFIAGFFLGTNQILKEKYLKSKSKIYDMRFN